MQLKPRICLTMLLLTLLVQGCQSSVPPAPLPDRVEHSTATLRARPDFPLAAAAAPEFVKACLHRINELEEYKANHP